MKDEALRLALEALKNNRRTHHYCEDTWYSCPKHEDGCANDSEGDECNCGADEANAEIDQAITAIKAALEAKDEPVAWYDSVSGWTDFHSFKPTRKPSSPSAEWLPLYAAPPQRKPLTDERLELIGHADLAINNIYIFNGYGEEVPEGRTPLYAGYTTPPQRTWVGLTNQELSDCWDTIPERAMKQVEAKLKEKNT